MKRMTHYHNDTPAVVRNVIDSLLHDQYIRVRIWYGDTKTGQAWNEEHDVTGYIGRSIGEKAVPLLIHNTNSMGGVSILDHCILRIDNIRSGQTLYKHEKFNAGYWLIDKSDKKGYKEVVKCNGLIVARFEKTGQADRYIKFMTGARYSK